MRARAPTAASALSYAHAVLIHNAISALQIRERVLHLRDIPKRLGKVLPLQRVVKSAAIVSDVPWVHLRRGVYWPNRVCSVSASRDVHDSRVCEPVVRVSSKSATVCGSESTSDQRGARVASEKGASQSSKKNQAHFCCNGR